MPFRLAEANSIFGEGQPGVSDTFGAALWGLELMFQVSGFASRDHLVNLFSTGADGAKRVPTQNLARFLLVFSAAAGMNLNLDEAYRSSAAVTVGACLGYLSSRFVFTDAAHAFRERLLEWLPAPLAQVKLGEMALQAMASPYMHCSYASAPAKHDIKAVMTALIPAGWSPCSIRTGTSMGQPSLVALLETALSSN